MTYIPKSKRLTIVFHDTESSTIPQIRVEGLERTPELCNETNRWMDKEAERRNLPIRRCNCNFAYLPGWGRLLKPGQSPLPSFRYKSPATISFPVDPTKVYTADMEVATEASTWHGVPKGTEGLMRGESAEERADLFRERYWDELKLLVDTKKDDFNEMEILIPFDIPPNIIRDVKLWRISH